MPLTKAKKNPQKTSERREEKEVGRVKEAEKRAEVFFSFFLRCEILEKYHSERSVFPLFIYLFLIN